MTDPPRGPVEGLLLDLDGVLVVSWKPIDGAIDTLAMLRHRGTIRRSDCAPGTADVAWPERGRERSCFRG